MTNGRRSCMIHTMRRPARSLGHITAWLWLAAVAFLQQADGLQLLGGRRDTFPSPWNFYHRRPSSCQASASSNNVAVANDSVEQASQVLAEWDKGYSSSQAASNTNDAANDHSITIPRDTVLDAVRFLAQHAAEQRALDPSNGRLMLGICASSAAQGIATLKSWVAGLELPRGLLHGMDEAGVPLEINGGVYIKYNSGGVYTFADIRKSGVGFDSLWKPGDAMLENYDGNYRGVYFQVELGDGQLRQYLCPLDLFDQIP